ncbi:MAG: endonuclease/exonuclease/phosphatase family protein [Tannerella sp.]|jgi:endonuclease/exonuclease/phosphatase family metal-dependent hydrolase|nr:endonuclease/exonuclease/phosphatase family protein [Tannerella sp.]
MQARNKKRGGNKASAGTQKVKWSTPLKVLFHSFFASLNIILAIFLIVSAYSDMISPEKHLAFAYLGLAFPILMLVNVCFFVYWILLKKWLPVFLLSVFFIACGKPFLRYCPFNIKTNVLPRENVIKILSYNVMSFAYKGHTKKSPNKIIQYIAESNADIVCLQEYMVSSRPNLMSSEKVAEALPMYPYIAEIIFSSPKNKHYKYGLAVLSKFPITKSRRITFTSAYNGASIHEIIIKDKKIILVNNHLESFKLTAEDRSKYSDMITRINLESLDELRGSIQQKLGQAFRIRAKQAETVAGEIRKANGNHIIACGDFNDTPISYAHRTLQGTLSDAYAESGFGMGISYNQNFFLFRIDHILYSPDMEAYNCKVDTRVNLSDHYPIYCYLKIN